MKLQKFGKDFANSTTFHGPNHVLETNSILIKLLWVGLFTAGGIYASKEAWSVFRDYRDQNILTSVSSVKMNKPQYSTLLYCPEDWLSKQKLKQYGMGSLSFVKPYIGEINSIPIALYPFAKQLNSEIIGDSIDDYEVEDMISHMEKIGCSSLECLYKKVSKDLDFPYNKSTKVISMGRVCHSIQNHVDSDNVMVFNFLHSEVEDNSHSSFKFTFNHFGKEYPVKTVKRSHVNVPIKLKEAESSDTLDDVLLFETIKLAHDKLENHFNIMKTIQKMYDEYDNKCWLQQIRFQFDKEFEMLNKKNVMGKLKLLKNARKLIPYYDGSTATQHIAFIMYSINELFANVRFGEILQQWRENVELKNLNCINVDSDDTIQWGKSSNTSNDRQAPCCDIPSDVFILEESVLEGRQELTDDMDHLDCLISALESMEVTTPADWMDETLFIHQVLSKMSKYIMFRPSEQISGSTITTSYFVNLEEIKRVNGRTSRCKKYENKFNKAILKEICTQPKNKSQFAEKFLLEQNVSNKQQFAAAMTKLTSKTDNNISYCSIEEQPCHEINFEITKNEDQRFMSQSEVTDLGNLILRDDWKTVAAIPIIEKNYNSPEHVEKREQLEDQESFKSSSLTTSKTPGNVYNLNCPIKIDLHPKTVSLDAQISENLKWRDMSSQDFDGSSTYEDEVQDMVYKKLTKKELILEAFERNEMENYQSCTQKTPCWYIRQLKFQFGNPVQYSERFEYTNMSLLASIGGLFGLFMGASLMSFVHAVVFCLKAVSCGKTSVATENIDET